jgi:hypothetical protein
MIQFKNLNRSLLVCAAFLITATPSGSTGGQDRSFNEEAIMRYIHEAHPSIGFLVRLKMMRAHLSAGLEASDRGSIEESTIHVHHPMSEIWADLEPELVRRGITSLKEALLAAEKAADGKDLVLARKTLSEAMAAIDALEAETSNAAEFQSIQPDVFAVLLRTAVVEYHEAFEGQVLRNVHEYKDGYFFIREAQSILEKIGPGLQSKNPEGFAKMTEALAKLYQAWPSVTPPEKIALPILKMQALVTVAELQLNRLR